MKSRRRRLAPVRDSEVDGEYGGQEEESGQRGKKLHIALNAAGAKLSAGFLEPSLYIILFHFPRISWQRSGGVDMFCKNALLHIAISNAQLSIGLEIVVDHLHPFRSCQQNKKTKNAFLFY